MKCAPFQLLLALVVGSFAAADDAFFDAPHQQAPIATTYHDCITHSCRLVPDVKPIKKTVYEVQEVPYCVKKLPPLLALLHHHGCACEACAQCDCVRYKKVLVKKEVTCGEIHTTKCIVQEHPTCYPNPPPCK